METATVPSPFVADFYRFALLLTGEAKAAECALAQALAEFQAEAGSLRSAASRNAWMVARLRQLGGEPVRERLAETAPRLLRDEAGDYLEIEAFIFARRFQRLPEPYRSALAVFYLELLTLEDAAKLFGLELEQWCVLLGRARAALRDIIHTAESSSASAVV